jgi:cell division septum initiation protein DivIVA
MCKKNDVVRHALFKFEQAYKDLQDENSDLKKHIDNLQYIIKVQRVKIGELESGRNL